MKRKSQKPSPASEAMRISRPGGRGRDIVPPAETSLSPRGGAKHRTLKKQILALLAEAGAEGRTTGELAEELGVLKVRVQSWFTSTGKRTPEVEKVAPGRWRYKRGAAS